MHAGGAGAAGVYGQFQTPAPGNTPGARRSAVTWTGTDGTDQWDPEDLGYLLPQGFRGHTLAKGPACDDAPAIWMDGQAALISLR